MGSKPNKARLDTSARVDDSETPSEETNSDEEPATAPYSKSLKWDKKFILLNVKIKNELKKNKYFEKTKYELLQLQTLSPPSTFELAQFAYKCCDNSQQSESNVGLPNGWKMLTTAPINKSGYFGIAYINIEKLQVVIAHRGAKNSNEEPYKTHLQAISERCFKQVHSAVTFAYEVIKELDEFKGKTNARFQIFFTGHGFGGWLAQVAAFSTRYLVKGSCLKNVFLQREDADDGYLVHTEVFDSAGCEYFLTKFVDDFDIRYEDKTIDLNNLDITNFVVSPNVVNCLFKHIGNVVLITKPDSDKYSFPDQYYQDSSSLELILDYLSTSSHDMRVVRDWPINNLGECDTLLLPEFKWLDKSAIPNTETEAFVYAQTQSQGYFPVRYQTKPFKENTCSLSVFTLPEQKFLKHFQWIRGVPEYFKPITMFKDILPSNEIESSYVLEQLQYLEIKSGKVKSLCVSGSSLGQLVYFLKRLLEFYPKLNDEAEKSLTIDEVRKYAYKNESIEYSNKLEKMTVCFSKKCGLRKLVKEFFKTDLKILQIRTPNDCDTDVVTAMLNNLLKKHEHYLVMRLQNVLALNKSVSLKEVLMSQAFGKVLLVFDCNPSIVNLDDDEVKEFFKQLVKVLINPNVKQNVKLIVISEIRTDITSCLEKLTKRKLKGAAKIVDFEGLKWTDLTSNAQEMLLSKNMVIFQGSVEAISLKHLLRENDVIQDIIDNSTIISLMKGRLIRIGNQIPDLGKITNSYVPRVFLLEFEANANVLLDRENTRDIIAISGSYINYEGLKQFGVKKDFVQMCDEGNFNIERGRIFILGENDRDQFNRLVEHVRISKIAKNVHWLTLESNILKWKETHGSVDYIKQNLHHNEDVITVFDKLYNFTDNRKTHNWEENEIENARRRMKSLVISDTVGMGKTTSLTSLSHKIKSNNPSLWVVRINLSDCTEVFKEVCKDFDPEKFGKPKVSNAVDFLLDKIMNCNVNTKLATTLEKNIFKRKLIDTGGVVLLFDAFDEISPNYESVFIELLSVLMKTKITNIFVTSRPFSKDQIETVLKTQCFVMRSFTMEDQVKLLVDVWLKNTNNESNDDLKNKAKKLMEVFRKSIRETNFAGVPLHCRLLAEVYEDTDISNISDNISLFSLYEAFEQKKIEVYENEKRKSTRGDINLENSEKLALRLLRQFHGQLAIEILYGNTDSAPIEMQDFEPDVRKMLEVIALKVGLVVRVKTPIQFVHLTFAEFFVAKFLINALEKPQIPDSIVQTVGSQLLYDRGYYMVRVFLHEYLANLKDCSSVFDRFSLDLKRAFEQIPFLDFDNETLKCMVNIFFNNSFTEVLTLNHLPRNFLPRIKRVLKKKEIPDYFGEEKLLELSKYIKQFLSSESFWKLFQNAIHYVKDHKGVVNSLIANIRDEMYLATEWFDAAQRGNVKDLRDILKKAGDEASFTILKLLTTHSSSSTVLNIAVVNGRLEAAKFLMELPVVKDLLEHTPIIIPFIFNFGNNSLLEDAVNSDSAEMVQLVASKLSGNSHMLQEWFTMAEIIDKNRDDMLSILLDLGLDTTIVVQLPDMFDSLLGYAVRQGKIKIVQKILSHGVDVNKRHEVSGTTVLHRSVFTKHPEGVSLLLKHGALVNAIDSNGGTPLHEAVKNTKFILPRIVILILNGGGNLNAVNHSNQTPFDLAIRSKNTGALVALLPLQPFVTSLDHDSRKFFWAKSLKLKLGLTEEKLKSLGLEIDKGGRFKHRDMDKQFNSLAITADYFVADYLVNKMKENYHEDFVRNLMIDIIVKDEFDVVKKFFNQLLYRHVFQSGIMHHIGDFLNQKFLEHKKNDAENTCNISLHQLVSDYQESILDFLLNCLKDTPLFLHLLTSLNENKQTVLYITIDAEYNELSNIILNSLRTCNPRDRKTILEATLHQDYAIQERINPLTKLMVNFDFLKEIRNEFEKTSQTLLKLNDAAINGKLDQLKEILQEVNTEILQRLQFASEETRDFGKIFRARTYYTALNLAVDGGHVESVIYLIENGFPLNPPYSEERYEWQDYDFNKRKIIIPALYNAIKNENVNMVKFLLKNGANINAYYSSWTALKVAVYYKFTEIVELLLNFDKNIEGLDDSLLLASERGYSDIVFKLLNAGANVNCKDETNCTPLHYAASYRNVDVVSAMLQKGAIINVPNSIGHFPLHIAAEDSSVEVVRLLLDKGAQVNVVNEDKNTPLHLAVECNNSDVIACLIKRGADIEAANAEGITPLSLNPGIIMFKSQSQSLCVESGNIKVEPEWSLDDPEWSLD